MLNYILVFVFVSYNLKTLLLKKRPRTTSMTSDYKLLSGSVGTNTIDMNSIY